MSAIDIVVIVIVSAAFLAVVGTIVYKKITHKDNGTCGGLCEGCPYHKDCKSRAKVSRSRYEEMQNKKDNDS